MTKDIWLNLPVKDVARSKAFFTALGFTQNTRMGDTDHFASFFIGDKKFVLMLFPEATFKSFTQHSVTDTTQSSEVLISIDAETPGEVDEMAKKAEAAGGTVYGKPGAKDGWMYGCGFTDLDGHRWNVLHMDMSKMPK
jgi:predicted lactoylglutathione lyase